MRSFYGKNATYAGHLGSDYASCRKRNAGSLGAAPPLGRNEFICWIEDAKRPNTRQRRIERTCEEIVEGKKRPCCWAGCIHRTDKAPGKWQQAVLVEKRGKV